MSKKEFSGPELTEGTWPAIALSASYGSVDGEDGAPQVQINVQICEGPDSGKRVTYEDQISNQSALYIARSCRAVGWRGQSLVTLRDDVAAWIAATGGHTSVDIKHVEIKRGKNFGKIWAKANAIGRGPKILKPLSRERIQDADEALRRATADDHGAPPADDIPHAASGPDDDIPFATCSPSSLGEIAKVLQW